MPNSNVPSCTLNRLHQTRTATTTNTQRQTECRASSPAWLGAALSVLTAACQSAEGAQATGTDQTPNTAATQAAAPGAEAMAAQRTATSSSGPTSAAASGGSAARNAATSSQAPGNTAAGAGATTQVPKTTAGSMGTLTNAAGASSGAAGAGAAGMGSTSSAMASAGPVLPAPVLPAIEDPGKPGPFGSEQVATAPGLETHTLFVPQKLGDQGVKHPILVWMNGATGSTSFYQNLLELFASHGFFVVADKMSGSTHDPEIAEQKVAIEWVLKEAARTDGPYYGKIDPDRLGIAGHSLGSVGSFANTDHPAVKASIHWSGGLTGNPVGADEAWLQRIHSPAAFLCGGAEARALPRCSGDFDNAPAGVPIFYGTVAGVGHTDVFGEPNSGQWGRAAIAWWRLMLAGDESFRSYFGGPDCTLCKDPWTGKSKGI